MISFEEALAAVMAQSRLLTTETVALSEAAGRILAQDVTCDINLPPFNKSAMDGYACRRGDLPGPLRVIETVQAGIPPKERISPGECAKIMTGAMVPEGADCVIMVEDTEETGEGTIKHTSAHTKTNICYCGEDVKRGDVVLQKGVRLGPQHIAILAAAGCAAPSVSRRPRVGILATGDELVEPECIPANSQIRNSNSWQLKAQVEQTGAHVNYYGIVPDTLSALDAVTKRALSESDVVLFSGGVSMGDFDLVPKLLKNNGIEILFDSVAMKPGKPTTFGIGDAKYCFGLPGNPISTFVVCEVLVKPFLFSMMGHTYRAPRALWPLAEPYTRKRAQRRTWVPVAFTDGNTVRPTTYHGSAHINALGSACGFIVVPPGITEIPKGTIVEVWSM